MEAIDLSACQKHVTYTLIPDVIQCGIVKITEGINYIDGMALTHVDGLRATGRIIGGYHYLRMRHGKPQDARMQARQFIAEVEALDLDFAVVDVETASNWRKGSATSATPDEARDAVSDFLDEFSQNACKKLLVYTSLGEWNLFGLNRSVPQAANYPLWIAALAVLNPVPPDPWSSHVLHQYSWTGKIPGIPSDVDLSRSAMTREEFAAFLAP